MSQNDTLPEEALPRSLEELVNQMDKQAGLLQNSLAATKTSMIAAEPEVSGEVKGAGSPDLQTRMYEVVRRLRLLVNLAERIERVTTGGTVNAPSKTATAAGRMCLG